MTALQISKHLADFVQRFEVLRFDDMGVQGFAVANKLGDPVVVTVLTLDGGHLGGGRFFVPADHYQAAKMATLVREAEADQKFVRGFRVSDAMSYFGLRGGSSKFSADFASRFAIDHAPGVDQKVWSDVAEAMLRAAGVDQVRADLNVEAIDALKCVSEFDSVAYEFYSADGDRGVVRRQAAGAYPLLAGEIALRFRVKMAVDRKEPPGDALVSAFGNADDGTPVLSKTVLKKLAGKQYSAEGVPVPTILESLSRIPVDWFPKDAAEWSAFVDLADTFFRSFSPEFGGKLDAMIAGAGGKWVDFAYRTAKAGAETQVPDELTPEEAAVWTPTIDATREGLQAAAANARDVLLAFRNLILLPVTAHAGNGAPVFVGPEQLVAGSAASAGVLFGGKALPAIMELTRHWHTQAHNILEATGDDDIHRGEVREIAEDGWAPLTDSWVAPNGVTLLPLTDPREIQDEGAGGLNKPGPDRNGVMGLGHCVGGYSQQCRNGTSHIVSLRLVEPDGSFERLSTVEFGKIDAETTELENRQHRGRKNGVAPAIAQEALKWFMDEVANKRIPLNIDGVMSYMAGRRRAIEEVEAYSGYDWRDAEILDRAFEPWGPYLPKRMRGFTREALLASPELAVLREEMVPTYSSAVLRQA